MKPKMATTSVFYNPVFKFLRLNQAADSAHFINPNLVLIVSFVAIYAASVAFLHPLPLHFASTLALSQFGK